MDLEEDLRDLDLPFVRMVALMEVVAVVVWLLMSST